jgi:hypothetical protein
MATMTERRRAPRQRIFKGGSITLPTGIVDCVVRNISVSGALLELSGPALVPNDFDLIIKPENVGRCCHVVRRDGHHLGVRFLAGL